MKRVLVCLVVSLMLATAGSFVNFMVAQDGGVADTLSIDDMPPVLYQEEEEEEPAKSSTGVYVAIAAGVLVAIVVGARMAKKKK